MNDFLQSFFGHTDPILVYGLLLVSAFLENVVPPIPGDTVVIVGAYLVSTGHLEFWGVYLATTLGSVAGFLTMYYIGRHFGRAFITKKSRARIFKEEYLNKVQIWFIRYGYWIIFANRFLSGTRSVISLFSGLFHLNAFYVSVLALLSALIWNALLISAGLLLGENWEVIIDVIKRYNQVFLVLFGLALLLWIYRRYRVRKETNEQS